MKSSKTHYPIAAIPDETFRGKIESCFACKKEIGLTRWDSWNNFLVKCPYCKGIHGQRWKAKNVLWISFFIQAFSFFFTMRFRNASIAFSIYILTAVIGNYLLGIELFPQVLEVFGAALFLLSPMIVNGIVLLKHNSHLRKQSDSKENVLDLLEGIRDLIS